MYTRRTWVFGFRGASFAPRGKASRRVIADSMARSDNAAMGCEGGAPGAENPGVMGIRAHDIGNPAEPSCRPRRVARSSRWKRE
jgi:hypothetical protein